MNKKTLKGDLVRVMWIAHGPHITHREIGAMVGLDRTTVTKHLKRYHKSETLVVGPLPSRINNLIELDNHADKCTK